MDLTARDIHEKQFHDAWRGYNQEEVDDFLDKVAEVVDLLQRENVAVLGRVRELEQALTTSRETEEMLKKTLVSAQQAAEEAIAKAQKKADAMVAEAEERSRRMTEESKQRLAALDAEIKRRSLDADREHTVRKRELDTSIERLGAFETDLKRRLKTFLEQQTRSLDTLTEADGAPARPGRATPARGSASIERSGAERGPGDRAAVGSVAADDTRVPPAEREDTPSNAGETLHIDEEPEHSGRRGVRSLFLRDDG
jgi:cell division initiation protein